MGKARCRGIGLASAALISGPRREFALPFWWIAGQRERPATASLQRALGCSGSMRKCAVEAS